MFSALSCESNVHHCFLTVQVAYFSYCLSLSNGYLGLRSKFILTPRLMLLDFLLSYFLSPYLLMSRLLLGTTLPVPFIVSFCLGTVLIDNFFIDVSSWKMDVYL